jgi:hypothetical protein
MADDRAAQDQKSEDAESPATSSRRFRFTLMSVLTVQVITLVLLWLLQRTYTP